MNLDKSVAALEQGLIAPETTMKRVPIKHDDMPNYGLRRKGEAVEYWVWMVAVGERGQAPTFYAVDHKLNGAMKKMLAMKGIQPNTRVRGGKKADGAPAAAG